MLSKFGDAVKSGLTWGLQVSQPEHNGDTGRIVDFDDAKGRYSVKEDESGEILALKPTNVQQIVQSCILAGIEGEPQLNNKSGTLLKFDAEKDRYNVRWEKAHSPSPC